MWLNIKPRGIHSGISIEVNFEAEIDKIAYVYRREEGKVKE